MRRLTCADLGAELGVSEQTVASWENEGEIPRGYQPLLAALLRVQVSWLLGETAVV